MSNPKLEDAIQHVGVLGMRWGVRKSENSSRNKTGTKSKSKKVRVAKTLTKGVAMALGLYHGDPNTKLNGKTEKIVGDILHYTVAVGTGGAVGTANHRSMGDKRIKGKGEKIVARHLDRVVRIGTAAGHFI